ncbi:LysR family transcriptional regulator [Paracoccus beibuensis]|uniref:LysR family transcriptional regulator n=1 Tax=Paracoccus beibuensis TaxID=547602 RepID=UPI00223EDC37|nr:LysR family transcriptional regulator [Paracoccus beibuensis]
MRIDAVTLRQLRALRAVADSGSLTTAAGWLGLTPPAVHGQLKAMEDLAGSALVVRGDGAFRAAPEGQALLRAEAQIATALSRATREVAALRQGQSGSVVLGVVSTGKYFAPALVALLRCSLPDIEVTLRIGNRNAIMATLAGDEPDLLMGRPPKEPAVTADLIGPPSAYLHRRVRSPPGPSGSGHAG